MRNINLYIFKYMCSINSIFVLTTVTAHWFLEQGFEPADISALPAVKKELYNFQRNSKVFTLTV